MNSEIFADISPCLSPLQAGIEASRCHYCYDAPCIQACPTGIDIPSFIRKIGNGNVRGAALDILGQNILGGSCARVCPVETLCQGACVRNTPEDKPVQIGRLQRFATDEYFKSAEQPFTRAPSSGKRVAVVGAGPAGLSCAHRLAMLGHEVTVFEARPKAGGLNEYGIAPYKLADGFAQREIGFLLGLGGIHVETGKALGRELALADLRQQYSAVFLSVGLGSNPSLGIPGEELEGVHDATAFIAKIRQAEDFSKLSIGRHVVVIGGGNTAVDIAIQAKRLGAEFVTLAYRRGREQMGATGHEQELAQTEGVLIKPWLKPHRLIAQGAEGKPEGQPKAKRVGSIEFEYTALSPDGRLQGQGRFLTLPADQVFKAIGQKLATDPFAPGVEISNGKFLVNERFETTLPGVYAGGDCVSAGEDLTVTAVQHGKLAAESIHQALRK